MEHGEATIEAGGPATVEREREVDASPEEVWEAIVDDERLGRWLGSDEQSLEVEPGGLGRFVFGGEVRYARVDEVSEHSRVGLTWWPSDGDGPASTVTIELAPTPERRTRIRVVETVVAARPSAIGRLARTAVVPKAQLSRGGLAPLALAA